MKYCTHCGKPLDPKAVICPNCGVPVNGSNKVPTKNNSQEFAWGWFVLSLFIPLIGVILYFVWQKKQPSKAKASIEGAIVGIILVFVIPVFRDFWIGFFQGFFESV